MWPRGGSGQVPEFSAQDIYVPGPAERLCRAARNRMDVAGLLDLARVAPGRVAAEQQRPTAEPRAFAAVDAAADMAPFGGAVPEPPHRHERAGVGWRGELGGQVVAFLRHPVQFGLDGGDLMGGGELRRVGLLDLLSNRRAHPVQAGGLDSQAPTFGCLLALAAPAAPGLVGTAFRQRGGQLLAMLLAH